MQREAADMGMLRSSATIAYLNVDILDPVVVARAHHLVARDLSWLSYSSMTVIQTSILQTGTRGIVAHSAPVSLVNQKLGHETSYLSGN